MKKVLAVLLSGFFVVNSFGAPTSAEQLRSEFEAALKAKDTNAVLALINWKGVSPQMRPDIIGQMTDVVMPNAVSVNLLPLPTDYQPTNEMDGVRYFPNVHVLGQVNVESAEKGNASQIPYGESGGGFYIAGVVHETFDTNAKKSMTLTVAVRGTFKTETPGIFHCSYVYIVGHSEKTDGFQCTNDLSRAFWGDYIKTCTVTKISGAGKFQLLIYENGKPIFDSGMVKTNDSISYEKKN